MRNAVYEEKKDGYTLKIFYDEEPEDPTYEWMPTPPIDKETGQRVLMYAFFHRRYNMGRWMDNQSFDDFEEFRQKEMADPKSQWRFIPVGMYEHGGVSIFFEADKNIPVDGFDSGLLGFVAFKMCKELYDIYGYAKSNKEPTSEAITQLIKTDAEMYFRYLEGDVFGYEVTDDYYDDEVIDSCYGFYGEDQCKEEGMATLEHIIATRGNPEERMLRHVILQVLDITDPCHSIVGKMIRVDNNAEFIITKIFEECKNMAPIYKDHLQGEELENNRGRIKEELMELHNPGDHKTIPITDPKTGLHIFSANVLVL